MVGVSAGLQQPAFWKYSLLNVVNLIRHAKLSWFLFVALLSLVILSGCDSADYKIITSTESPNGEFSGLLIQRRAHGPLSSDVYYVVLTDTQQSMPTLSKLVHDKPLLVVTHGQDLTLQWSGANSMKVTCANCGIKKLDVMERNERWRSVEITYLGIPIPKQ
jgi:hypothetical protein